MQSHLSRRAVSYHLWGLSFREFFNFETGSELLVFYKYIRDNEIK